jgi:hypothetical protein
MLNRDFVVVTGGLWSVVDGLHSQSPLHQSVRLNAVFVFNALR